jgi:hypothetical protein
MRFCPIVCRKTRDLVLMNVGGGLRFRCAEEVAPIDAFSDFSDGLAGDEERGKGVLRSDASRGGTCSIKLPVTLPTRDPSSSFAKSKRPLFNRPSAPSTRSPPLQSSSRNASRSRRKARAIAAFRRA